MEFLFLTVNFNLSTDSIKALGKHKKNARNSHPMLKILNQ